MAASRWTEQKAPASYSGIGGVQMRRARALPDDAFNVLIRRQRSHAHFSKLAGRPARPRGLHPAVAARSTDSRALPYLLAARLHLSCQITPTGELNRD